MLPITQDITNLVLFSGGINSTGVCYSLEAANEKYCCVNLVIEFPGLQGKQWSKKHRYQNEVCRNFCSQHNIPLATIEYRIYNTTTEDMIIPLHINNMKWLGFAASAVLFDNPQINKVYYGSSVEDFARERLYYPLDSVIKGAIEYEIELIAGLKDQNKHYIYNYIIGDDFRENVTSCWLKDNLLMPRYCGNCYKCVQLKSCNIIQ